MPERQFSALSYLQQVETAQQPLNILRSSKALTRHRQLTRLQHFICDGFNRLHSRFTQCVVGSHEVVEVPLRQRLTGYYVEATPSLGQFYKQRQLTRISNQSRGYLYLWLLYQCQVFQVVARFLTAQFNGRHFSSQSHCRSAIRRS